SNHDKITVVVETMAGTCSIQVRDQGIGIPDEDLPHVFEPFFRASNSKKFEGFGVGLPLAMNIARIHQGTIKVDSLEGKGTRVSLILPLI
ncbi:MAG TPA: ATP-binding protein, partial [Flavihumibacter sp.]|nr:ATP-binding protein [Flavihumibacter sp.]